MVIVVLCWFDSRTISPRRRRVFFQLNKCQKLYQTLDNMPLCKVAFCVFVWKLWQQQFAVHRSLGASLVLDMQGVLFLQAICRNPVGQLAPASQNATVDSTERSMPYMHTLGMPA